MNLEVSESEKQKKKTSLNNDDFELVLRPRSLTYNSGSIKWLRNISYLRGNGDFRPKKQKNKKNKKIKIYVWNTLQVTWDSDWDTWYKPEHSLNVWSVFSNFGKGSVNVQSGMSLFDTIAFC